MKTIPLHLQLFTVFQEWAKSIEPRFSNPEAAWLGFFKRIRAVGIKHIEYMPYTVEKKGFYNTLQPFKKAEEGYNLDVWKPSYWKKLTSFLKLTQKAKIKMIPVVFSKYQERPFLRDNNVNGAAGLFGGDSLYFENKFIAKLMRLTAKIQKGKPWVRLSNEVRHKSHAHGVTIAQHHEAWYEKIKKFVPLKNVKNDISFTDFTALAEKHYLLTDGSIVVASNWDGIGTILETWGKDEYDRLNWLQVHGMPKRLSMITEGRPWRDHIAYHSSVKKWDLSTDGCTEGSGYKLAGTPYCNMNEAEIIVFATEVWGYAGKRVVISELPKEVFYRDENGIIASDVMRLDITRLEAYAEAWDEMSG